MKLAIWPRYELRQAGRRVPLPPHEGLIMTALLSHREASLDLLVEVVWPHPDDMPDLWYRSLMVRLHHLRRALRTFGWTIAVRQGFGWRLVGPSSEGRLAA